MFDSAILHYILYHIRHMVCISLTMGTPTSTTERKRNVSRLPSRRRICFPQVESGKIMNINERICGDDPITVVKSLVQSKIPKSFMFAWLEQARARGLLSRFHLLSLLEPAFLRARVLTHCLRQRQSFRARVFLFITRLHNQASFAFIMIYIQQLFL